MLLMYVVCRGDTGAPDSGKDILRPLAVRHQQEICSMLHNTCAIHLIFIVDAQELPKFGRARVEEAEAVGVLRPSRTMSLPFMSGT